ncbi:nucleoside-diphosphate kinase [Streptomyces cavernae]|uniref:nucleoside-diphosphate kinase n=1 Tax=Streptomyces cavernae TaxID=2259034 RepID=UPI00139087E9|nr:nucleoside-diphosphate kinase [Streptomyces cavernae]
MSALDYRRTALFLIAPDGLRRGLGGEIVDRLGRGGFRIVGHRLWPTAPPNLEPFHRRNAPVAQDPELYRTVEELFALGPMLALAVESGTSHPPYEVHRRLAELKGRGDPACALPGSIRKDLRSINTVLNIVHSSDSPQDTAQESAIFLEAGAGPMEHGTARLRRALRVAERAHPTETRDFTDVLAGVRARLLANLWPRLAPDQREHVDKWCTQSGLRSLGSPAGGELVASVAPPCSAAENLDDSGLAALGVRLDPWEHLVLTSSRRYPPPPPDDAVPSGALVSTTPRHRP